MNQNQKPFEQKHHENLNPEVHWTRQLYREYEEIVWYYKAPLKLPVIQIADLKSRWGQWDPFFRTITLSRNLITQHSWDVVLEVLKHEMAHQYVSEVLKAPDDNTHGELYKEACEELGVAGWASKATGEIPEVIPTLRERVLNPEDERLLARAEKLLALAQSGNEHEALLAMQRVRELYTKHDLERLRASKRGTMDSLIICRKRLRMEPHEAMIYTILNEHFFVRVVHTSLFHAVDLKKYKAAELLGTRENLLMAEYVFYFLLKQCELLWKEHQKSTGTSARLKRSYQLGVLHGFSEKLSHQGVQAKVSQDLGMTLAESKALIAQAKVEIQDYVGHRFPRIATRSQRSPRVDGATFSRGQSAGRSINLHRGVTSGIRRFGGFLDR